MEREQYRCPHSGKGMGAVAAQLLPFPQSGDWTETRTRGVLSLKNWQRCCLTLLLDWSQKGVEQLLLLPASSSDQGFPSMEKGWGISSVFYSSCMSERKGSGAAGQCPPPPPPLAPRSPEWGVPSLTKYKEHCPTALLPAQTGPAEQSGLGSGAEGAVG